jgi:hypothetical protein
MDIHKPKAAHNLREFLVEIGTIICGILIALGLEQAVEALHWHAEVREFRKAVGHEFGMNLAAYQYMLDQRPCVAHRLSELKSFLAGSSDPSKSARAIGTPDSVSFYYSVWDSKEPAITAHLGEEERQKYAELYDELRNADSVRLREREVWRSLSQFDQPEPLDHSDRMRLRELVNRAEQLDASARLNWGVVNRLARPLRIVAVNPSDNALPEHNTSMCQPLFK